MIITLVKHNQHVVYKHQHAHSHLRECVCVQRSNFGSVGVLNYHLCKQWKILLPAYYILHNACIGAPSVTYTVHS